jgi:hypothetical protein
MTELEQYLTRKYGGVMTDPYKAWQTIQELPDTPTRAHAAYNLFRISDPTYRKWVKKDQVEVGK